MHLPLHNSTLTALVDDADHATFSVHLWRIETKRGKSYAVATINGRRKFLHRLVMGEPRGMLVDHRDGNGLNCQRSNLRACTRSQNGGNSRKHRDRAGRYKGVYYERDTGKYAAQICHQGRTYKLGRFKRPILAALAYDTAAIKLFGDFAKTNFPPPKSVEQHQPLAA